MIGGCRLGVCESGGDRVGCSKVPVSHEEREGKGNLQPLDVAGFCRFLQIFWVT